MTQSLPGQPRVGAARRPAGTREPEEADLGFALGTEADLVQVFGVHAVLGVVIFLGHDEAAQAAANLLEARHVDCAAAPPGARRAGAGFGSRAAGWGGRAGGRLRPRHRNAQVVTVGRQHQPQ